ncbi:MAG TPA: 3-isopropylmalate dehydratase [Candidatus Binatia bacterium]|jgi:3-isopropylmalate/(R)-2-methylmalate dehydratase small subunit|nr:3-isopropylmalate dehydratase [Candidatus Binatia bacterium]
MKKSFKGKVWKFGDCIDSGNIKGVMAGIDPEFHTKVQPGDLIVAGINFGMGSSSEDAPRSLRDAGIAAVLAESISNIYLRTLINLGLPAIECSAISTIVEEGHELEVDLESGRVRNLTTGNSRTFAPFSDHAIAILEKGGLIPYLKSSLGQDR